MTNVRDPEARRLDFGGFITFSVSLFLLIFALLRGNDEGWSSPTIVGALVAAAVLMVTFVVIEARQRTPMLDLSLFGRRAFSGVSVTTFALGGGMFAMFPYITLYFQNLLGYSPLQGGLRVLPATLLIFIVPLAVRTRVVRLPAGGVLGVGMALIAGGLPPAMRGLTVTSGWTAFLPGMLLTGFGIGLANPAVATIALGVVPPARSGMASGINNTFRLGGLATGVAALGAVFQHVVQTKIDVLLPPSLHGTAAAVTSGGPRAAALLAPAGDRVQVAAAGRVAYVAGMNDILLVAAVTVVIGAFSAFAFVRARDLAQAAPPGRSRRLPPARYPPAPGFPLACDTSVCARIAAMQSSPRDRPGRRRCDRSASSPPSSASCPPRSRRTAAPRPRSSSPSSTGSPLRPTASWSRSPQ